MFISSLKLKNFQSIRQAEFKFRKGIICFTGDNGEGKSTVLHAITMLLFNSYDGNLKDYITWGEKEFQISIDFSHEGVDYTESLSYSLTKGSERTIVNNDTGQIFSGLACVTQLNKILDPSQASAAIVAMENQQNLVSTTPSQRREYLKKIYSLEFKEEIEKIAQDISRAENDIIRLQTEKDVLEASQYPLKEELELPDEKEYKGSVQAIQQIESQIQSLKEQVEKLDRLEIQRRDITSQLYMVEKKTSQAKESLSRLASENDSLEKDLHSLSEKDVSKENRIKVEEEQKSYELTKQSYQQNIHKIQAELDGLPLPTRVSRRAYEELLHRESELSYAYSAGEKKLKALAEGICPTCGREISSADLEAERESLQQIDQELSKVRQQKASEQKQIESLTDQNEKTQRRREQVRKDLDDAVHSLSLLEESHKSTLDRLNLLLEQDKLRLENEISQKTQKLASNEDLIKVTEDSLASFERQNVEYEARLKEVESEIQKIEDPSRAIQELESSKKEPLRVVKEYEDAVAYNKSIQVYNSEMLERQAERDAKVSELDISLTDLNQKKTMMTVAKGIVQREFPSFVISRMVETLSAYVNEFLQKVYSKYQISIEESKNSLNFLFGEFKSDVKMASGFEKSVFSLAYMYALGKIQSYGLLICDEGDAAASDENAARFYQTLGHSLEWLEQIMCITHKGEIKDLLKNDFHAQVFSVEHGEFREVM